jgi:hypothetical protein
VGRKTLAAFVIIGCLLDLGVFGFQTIQYRNLAHIEHHAQCWDSVLDRAVTAHPTPALKSALTADARRCAGLP